MGYAFNLYFSVLVVRKRYRSMLKKLSMPHRFEAFVFLFLIGSVMLICPGCSGPEVPPNVLFIAIDDLRPELGCYGNDLIQTPNMDRIADQGFVFKKHYVQVPTCGASRCALLTGMRPRSRQQPESDGYRAGLS